MDQSRALKSDSFRLGVLMALCLALGIYLIATTVLISKDGVFYIRQAQSFAHDPLAVAQRHQPGYPLLLWVAHEAAGLFTDRDSVFAWIHLSQAVTLLCRTLALIPLYFLGKSLIGSARAFWAILILISLPYPAQVGSDVLRDWPYVMFLGLGFWFLHIALQRRTWWLLALVGLNAAAGYLIQPAAAQLLLYGLIGLAVAFRGEAKCRVSTGGRSLRSGPLIAAVLLIAGFAVPVLPYVWASGTWVPPQLQRPTFNSAPAVTAAGGRATSRNPLEFEVREGELLEVGVEAYDAQDDDLTFTAAAVALGSRPVYQFRLAAGDRFVTISEDERNTLLDVYAPAARAYDGIVYYAYAQADARPGLEPVHRFWSPTLQRHFYTIGESQKDAALARLPKDLWAYEGIAFYAFAPGRQPPDAVPVHRFASERVGYVWAVAAPGQGNTPVSDSNAADAGIEWYVHTAGAPPAGMAMEGRTLRWRPGPGQRGEYGINIIVSDGDMQSCQLVNVTVHEGPSSVGHTGDAYAGVSVASACGMAQYAGLSRLPGAVDMLFDGFAESLMVFFLVPWAVGLYYRMRYKADRLERVLTTAVIAVNAGLILGRYVWVVPSMERRYCLALVALTIFYVPVGLERIALGLSRRGVARDDQLSNERVSRWFLVLALIGIGICLPKALRPLYAEKRGYVTAIQWLRENTEARDVIAVPDTRLAFYAERRGLVYRDHVDPRQADYIVRLVDKDGRVSLPAGWREQHAIEVDGRKGRMLVIYGTGERRPQ